MSKQWIDDMKRSSAIAQKSLPILQEIFNDKKLQIIQVENKPDEVCEILDKTCGIDYFILRSDKQIFGVAWRCQWVFYKKTFDSFTIRKSRDSGATTEYEKRKQALQLKSIYPYYVVQTYCDAETDEILSMGLTTTEDEIAYIDNPITFKEVRKTGKDKIGQAEFYVLYWIDMKINGYKIIVYKKDVGIT